MARWMVQAGEQPVIKWEEQAFEVLHNRSEVRLNLDFCSSSILGPRKTVVYFCLGEESFALPHPFRGSVTEFWFIHLGPALRRTGPDPCAGVRIGCGEMSADSWRHNSQPGHNHDMHLVK